MAASLSDTDDPAPPDALPPAPEDWFVGGWDKPCCDNLCRVRLLEYAKAFPHTSQQKSFSPPFSWTV